MGYENIVFPQKTKFLVTGGAGFIGSNLCEALLERGYLVRCLDNLSTGKKENIEMFLENSNFEFIQGDIRDLDTCLNACKGMDYVSHQAAWGSVPRSIEMPLLYEEINIKGTLNMLEAARQNNIKRFVYASSSSVYGDEATLPKKEGKEGNLLSPYALTKRVNEEYAKMYTKLYGLETIGFRYFNVFGKRQNPEGAYAAVIPKFIKALLKDDTAVIYGDGSQSRDFTYIENVIEANFKAMNSSNKDAYGKIFNIACGGEVSLNELYWKICNLLEKNTEPRYEKERKGDIKHSNADINEACELLSYNPNFDFDKGILLTLKWYTKN